LRVAPALSITGEEATEGYQIMSDAVHRAASD